jgi:DNA-binding NarL/FixJ family response regulator
MIMMKTFVQVSVIIADDHEIFRDGFRIMAKKYPEINLVGEAENGIELIQLVEELKPDVILTDIKMPKMDGIEATKLLLKKFPDCNIIALSMFDEDNLIIDMLEAGAKGYLLKNSNKEEIVEAIKMVNNDQNYYCKHTSAKLVKMIASSKYNPNKKSPKPQFSEKEIEIIKLICEQFSNKEIASKLHLSVRTIEGYREKIQEKMSARNTAGIVINAIQNGIHKIDGSRS